MGGRDGVVVDGRAVVRRCLSSAAQAHALPTTGVD